MRKITNGTKKITKGICLSENLIKETQTKADKLGISLSSYVEMLLRKYTL